MTDPFNGRNSLRSEIVTPGVAAPLQVELDAYEQLPAWMRRAMRYTTFDVCSLAELEQVGSETEAEWIDSALQSERLVADEIGVPPAVFRDRDIAPWSGLRGREARKGMIRRRRRAP